MPVLLVIRSNILKMMTATCLSLSITHPGWAETNSPTQTGKGATIRVIITNVGGRQSRIHEVLARYTTKQKADPLALMNAEVVTIPTSKLPQIQLRLAKIGSRVIKIRENGDRILMVNEASNYLTPDQMAVMNANAQSPEAMHMGVLKMPHAEITESILKGEGTKVVLPLRGGKSVSLVRTEPIVNCEGGFTWRGEVEETGERAVLMQWNDGHVSGYFSYKGHIFRIDYMGGNIHTMTEIDPDKMPPEHEPEPRDKAGDPSLHDNASSDNSSGQTTGRLVVAEPKVPPFRDEDRRALEAKKITVDLMLLYTKNAARYYIGNLADRLPFPVEQANATFRNSGLGNITLRLVHSQMIDFDEAGASHFNILYRMVDKVGPFKDIEKLRNEKHADIVGLIIDSPKGCGLSTRVGADSEQAYFVVHHACAAVTLSIAHEIGHIFGARHDRVVDASNEPLPYAHGFINGTKWRTMMGYNDGCGGCPRIPYWSNPRVMYKGEPTGTDASDNARVILEEAERISKFR